MMISRSNPDKCCVWAMELPWVLPFCLLSEGKKGTTHNATELPSNEWVFLSYTATVESFQSWQVPIVRFVEIDL